MVKRPPRILHPVSSLAGRLALLGLRSRLVATIDADYNGLEVTVHSHNQDYRTLWYLAPEDPFHWAFRLLDDAGSTLFQSLAPLPTREGVTPLVSTQAQVPLLHVTTQSEVVAQAVAHFDYSLCAPPAVSPLVLP